MKHPVKFVYCKNKTISNKSTFFLSFCKDGRVALDKYTRCICRTDKRKYDLYNPFFRDKRTLLCFSFLSVDYRMNFNLETCGFHESKEETRGHLFLQCWMIRLFGMWINQINSCISNRKT
jgi:hypothetical protein